MNSSVHHVLVVCLVMVVAVRVSAHYAPQDYVDAHNCCREEVGCPPVQWNETVAEFARWYASQRQHDCEMIHSHDPPYGENLAAGLDMTGPEAVELWCQEKAIYNAKTNLCTCEDPIGCCHYTQVVWRTTTCIGCAHVKCSNNGYTFITCNYYPRGNEAYKRPY